MPNNTEHYIMPSTLENIDSALYEWINESLNIHTISNEGWKKVPVIWSNAERAFMVKNYKDRRDGEGSLVYPLITVERTSVEKNLAKKGSFGANLFANQDVKGGVIAIARQIQQEKTKEFVNNDTYRLTGRVNYPKQQRTNTAVYEILYTPYPTYLDMSYDITLRTEYIQQMNEIVVPFMAKTGGINSFLLKKNGHQYESFIQSNFNLESNTSALNDQERIFTTKVQIKVLGYILGQDKNEPQPKVVVRETAAKFRFQRERVVVGDIPQHIGKEGFYRP
jgi:hypothetical protein